MEAVVVVTAYAAIVPVARNFVFTRPSVEIDIMGIGWQELLLVALVVMLLFGSAKLPSLMRNLGRSATEFKKGMRDDSDDTDDRIEARKEDTKIST